MTTTTRIRRRITAVGLVLATAGALDIVPPSTAATAAPSLAAVAEKFPNPYVFATDDFHGVLSRLTVSGRAVTGRSAVRGEPTAT